MNEKTPFGMSNEAFKALVEEYIERGSEEPDDLDADLFFDGLADFMTGPTETTIELEGKWHNGHLALSSGSPVPPDIQVYDNCIVTPGFTFVIRLEPLTNNRS
jgi:hypothetical protein